MKMPMFSIFDTKALSFSQPFVLPSDAEALRGFHHLCSDPTSKFAVYPEDYDLYAIGALDDKTGWLEPEAPRKLTSAIAAKAEIIDRRKKADALLEKIPTLQDCINETAPN